MRRLLRNVVASAWVSGPVADSESEGVMTVGDEHPSHERFGVTAAKVAAEEKRAQS